MAEKRVSVRFSASGGKEVKSEAEGIRLALHQTYTDIDRQSKSAAASADVFTAAINQQEAEFKALRGSLDPAFAAMTRYEAQVETINRAVAMGAATQAEANRVIAQAQAVLDQAVSSYRTMGPSVEAFNKALADEQRAFTALRASVDPAFAATRQFEAAQEAAQRAVARGAATQEEANQVLAQAKARFEAATGVTRQVGQATQSARVDVANLGYQFNDIGVMLAAGQSPLMLAVQQGTQISQVLGPLGARGAVSALGAAFTSFLSPVTLVTVGVIAAGAAIIQSFTKGEDAVKDLDDAVADLAGAVDDLKAANDALFTLDGIQAQIDKYGELDAAVLQLIQRQRQQASEAASNRADEAIQSVIDKATGGWLESMYRSDLGSLAALLNMDEMISQTDNYGNSFSVVNPKIVEFREALEAARAAATLDDKIAAFADLSEMIEDTALAGTEFARSLIDAEEEFRELQAESEAAGKAINEALESAVSTAYEFATAALSSATNISSLNDVSLSGIWSGFDGLINRARSFLGLTNDIRGVMDPAGWDTYYSSRAGTNAGRNDEELIRAVVQEAARVGLDAQAILTVMGVESAWRPAAVGGAGGNYQGLIQFGPEERRTYGVDSTSSIAAQAAAAVEFLIDRGVRPGDSENRYYAAVLAGNASAVNAGDTGNGGRVGNITSFVNDPNGDWSNWEARSAGALSAYGGVVREITEAQDATEDLARDALAAIERADKEAAAEAERILKQAQAEAERIRAGLRNDEEALAARKAELDALVAQGALSDPERTAELERYRQELHDSNEEVKAAEEVLRSIEGPEEEWARRVAELTTLLEAGRLTQEQFNRAVAALGTDEVAAALENINEAAQRSSEALGQSAEFGKSVFGGMISDLRQGASAAEIFANALDKVAGRLIDTSLDSLFGTGDAPGPLASLFSGLFPTPAPANISAPPLSALPSFDGGGFTGAGSRSGGLDGKGGYLAMVHPDEIVSDLTKIRSRGTAGGGAGRQVVDVRVGIDPKNGNVTAHTMRVASELDRRQGEERDRVFNGKVQAAQRDPRSRARAR